MPGWALKLLAALLTVASTAGSAVFVGGHVKNAAAPLHPAVMPGGGPLSRLSPQFGETSPAAGSEQSQVQPSVQAAGDQQPLTGTYVS